MTIGNLLGGFQDRAIDLIKDPDRKTLEACERLLRKHGLKNDYSEEETQELVDIVIGKE